MRMTGKSSLPLWLPLLGLAAAAAVAGDNPVPTSMPAERYAEMESRSPFALASAAAPAPPVGESFAANWYVSGMARLNGEDFVSIKSRDQAVQFSLHGRSEDVQTGVGLAAVEWAEDAGRSTVILRKGNETARLEFNRADLGGMPQVTAVPRPVGFASPALPMANLVAGSSAGAFAQLRPPEIRRRVVPIPGPR